MKAPFVLPEEYEAELRRSEFPMRDAFYNWIVTAYAKRGKKWTTKGIFSDRVFFSALFDQAWPWVPMLLFIYVFYWVTGWVYDRYGLARAVMFMAVMMLFRLNVLIRQVTFTNKLLKGRQ